MNLPMCSYSYTTLNVDETLFPEQADDWESGITAATVGAAFLFSFVGGFITDK